MSRWAEGEGEGEGEEEIQPDSTRSPILACKQPPYLYYLAPALNADLWTMLLPALV